MNNVSMKNKKIIVVLSLLLIVIIALSTVGYLIYNRELIYIDSLSIKIGEEIPTIDDYVDKKELKRLKTDKIVWENINGDDNKIYSAGKYTGYIIFRNKKINLNLEVIDEEQPNIDGVKDITIYVNEKVDLLKNVKVTDNSHNEVDIKINGEYKTSKAGTYKLSYVATDKSGNQTIKDFKLIVKEKAVATSNNSSTTIKENKVIGTSSKGYTIRRINGIYYVNNILIANKTYALPSNYAPGGLIKTFTTAFNNMKKAAANEGITLKVVSGYRSYSRQKTLYNNYVNRDGKSAADTYSARAGHSEHQTGLAADINSVNSSFINTKEGKWLNDNCYKYGFIIRYPKGKQNITGYMYEPWHIRYVGVDVATSLYNNGSWISLEEYLGITSKYSY